MPDTKMAAIISAWLNKKYPQNYVIKNPFIGTIIFFIFCIFFAIVYKPLEVHESRFFSHNITVTVYFIIVAFPFYVLIKILKRIRYYSNADNWTIFREISSIVILLSGIGITVYFSGFLLEPPIQRWNIETFLNSLFSTFLIGIVPFGFFTVINYRYLLVTDIIKNFNTEAYKTSAVQSEELIRIESQLKKEELVFYPDQLIYAESDGNYIVFHLNIENQAKKRIIRNSISNIEQQLAAFPFLFRTHRAFIINIKKVSSQKGNTLGYRLKLAGTDTEIPVSRQKTRDFDKIMKQYL
jgi:hypothetical protein